MLANSQFRSGELAKFKWFAMALSFIDTWTNECPVTLKQLSLRYGLA
jgi:hypothetical protein